SPPAPPKWRFEPPSEASRAAAWELAGPLRRADELERLTADPYRLARTVGACALERRESRGAHRRLDAPSLDPGLDRIHLVQNLHREIRHESWD
ncbi:MAG: L-aspartate oxidase, partial [Solirubrobacterales bacterium]